MSQTIFKKATAVATIAVASFALAGCSYASKRDVTDMQEAMKKSDERVAALEKAVQPIQNKDVAELLERSQATLETLRADQRKMDEDFTRRMNGDVSKLQESAGALQAKLDTLRSDMKSGDDANRQQWSRESGATNAVLMNSLDEQVKSISALLEKLQTLRNTVASRMQGAPDAPPPAKP